MQIATTREIRLQQLESGNIKLSELVVREAKNIIIPEELLRDLEWNSSDLLPLQLAALADDAEIKRSIVVQITLKPSTYPHPTILRQLAVTMGYNQSQAQRLIKCVFPTNVFADQEESQQRNLAEGEWLTVSQMARRLEVDYKWVIKRLPNLSHSGIAKPNCFGKSSVHYPQVCLAELQRMRDDLSRHPYADERYATVGQLALKVGRSQLWVKNRLELLNTPNFRLRDPSGRVANYYLIEVLKDLEELLQAQPDAGDWLTVIMLTSKLDLDREWILARLTKLGIMGEMRYFTQSGRVDLCYPPSVVEQLQSIASLCLPYQDGWYTLNKLVSLLDKSINWVRSRLTELKAEPVMRKDIRGVERLHYDDQVLNCLQELKQQQLSKRAQGRKRNRN